MSAEACEKLRIAALAQWNDPIKKATLMANRVGTTGKRYSEASKLKMSTWQLGRKMSDEAKRKMSLAKKGDQSVYVVGDRRFYPPPARKGGGTWANAVKRRDNYKCVLCGDPEEICAHHIYSFADYPALRCEVSNGLTLCQPCHVFVHKKNHAVA